MISRLRPGVFSVLRKQRQTWIREFKVDWKCKTRQKQTIKNEGLILRYLTVTYQIAPAGSSFFPYQMVRQYSDADPTVGPRMQGVRNSRFSANILLYLGNDTRQSHCYHRMQTENHIQAFKITNATICDTAVSAMLKASNVCSIYTAGHNNYWTQLSTSQLSQLNLSLKFVHILLSVKKSCKFIFNL